MIRTITFIPLNLFLQIESHSARIVQDKTATNNSWVAINRPHQIEDFPAPNRNGEILDLVRVFPLIDEGGLYFPIIYTTIV